MSDSSRRGFLRRTTLLAASVAMSASAITTARTESGRTERNAKAGSGRPFRVHMILPRREDAQEFAFHHALLRRGIKVEMVIDIAGENLSRLPEILSKVQKTRPDLVYTTGTPTTLAVVGRFDQPTDSYQIRDIPVIFTAVTDPVGSGILASLERPGRNVTGSSHVAPLESQLRTILAYRPVQRLGMIYNPDEPNAVMTAKNLAHASADRDIVLIQKTVPLDSSNQPDLEAIPDLVADLAGDGAQFLYIGPDTFLAGGSGAAVTRAAIAARLPSFSATEPPLHLQPGALVGLVSAAMDQGLAAAYKAEQILVRRRSPAELPANPLSRYSLLINVATARQLQSYPPLDLIALAEFVGA